MKAYIKGTAFILASTMVVYALYQDPAGFEAGTGSNTVTNRSMAAGSNNQVDKESIAAGKYNVVLPADDGGCFAAGGWNEISTWGAGSACIGNMNSAQALGLAVGFGNDLVDNVTLGVGHSNYVDGYGSVLIGRGNTTNGGSYSIGIGDYLIANSYSLTVGRYNNPATAGTKVFVVGSGTSSTARENALEVHQDGSIRIGKAQGDISMGAYQ